jgi:hypothetical protein
MFDDVTFERWMKAVFGPNEPKWKDTPEVTVACIERTFRDASSLLTGLPEESVVRGLGFIIYEAIFELKDEPVEWALKERTLDSIVIFFETFFAPIWPEGVTFERGGKDPLLEVCALWWMELPIHGLAWHAKSLPDAQLMDLKVLEAMGKILSIDSDACRESALSGFSEWYLYYPKRVRSALEAFLRNAQGSGQGFRDEAECLI